MAPFLANELEDILAAYLDDHKPSFHTLSLASREWTAPSQSRLFRSMTLKLGSDCDTRGLIELLRTSHHLVPHIREFVLSGGLDGGIKSVEAGDVVELAALIPALRSLTVLTCDIKGSCLDKELTDPIRNLCHLSLLWISVDERTFSYMLSQLKFHTLSLEGLGFNQPTDDYDISINADDLATVQALRLAYNQLISPRVCVWLGHLWSIIHDHLVSLDIEVDLQDDVEMNMFITFVKTKGRSLRTLRLNFDVTGRRRSHYQEAQIERSLIWETAGPDGFGGIPSNLQTVELSDCCDALQALEVVLYVDWEPCDRFRTGEPILQWCYALRLLSSAPQTLARVTIGLILSSDVDHEPSEQCTVHLVDWAKWDSILH